MNAFWIDGQYIRVGGIVNFDYIFKDNSQFRLSSYRGSVTEISVTLDGTVFFHVNIHNKNESPRGTMIFCSSFIVRGSLNVKE